MPTYCYITGQGEREERICPMSEVSETIMINGHEAHRDFQAEQRCEPRGKEGYPHTSCAMAVLPSQVKERMAVDKKLGVTARFDRKGRPIMESASHQRQYMKAHKMDFTD